MLSRKSLSLFILLITSLQTACVSRPDYSSSSVNVISDIFDSEVISQNLPVQHNATFSIGNKGIESPNLYSVEINGQKTEVYREQKLKRIYFKQTDQRKYKTAYNGANFDEAAYKYVYFPANYSKETLEKCHTPLCSMWYGQKSSKLEFIEFATFSQRKYLNSKKFDITDNGVHVFHTFSDGSQNKFNLELDIPQIASEEVYPYNRYPRKKPVTLTQLDTLALEIAKDFNLFISSTRVDKKPLMLTDLSAQSPTWVNTFFSKENGRTHLNVKLKAPGFAFTKDAKQLGIEDKYHYLIEKFIDKKRFAIGVSGPNRKQEDLSLSYYDGSRIKAEITRLENLGHGYVRLTANQKDVVIYIDGKKVGVIGNKPFVTKLKEGRHTFTAKKRFFMAKTRDFILGKDEAFAHEFILKTAGNMDEQVSKGKIVQKIGKLTLLSERNDISVFIDGAERVPPITLPNMAQGKYKIKIVAPEKTKYLDIVVGANKNNVINIDDIF